MHRILFLVFCWLLVSVQIGQAADARQGETLAKRWCADCHAVSREQVSATTQAPPFSEIAKADKFDAASVALFLLAPHPRMPDMNLSRSEAADLAAYIGAQRR
jgi:mono/diheme cytochrome c family protein